MIIIVESVLLMKVTFVFFFQAEDGIRDLVRSRGLGDVYKRQQLGYDTTEEQEQQPKQQPTVGVNRART